MVITSPTPMSGQPTSALQNNSRSNPAEDSYILVEEQALNAGYSDGPVRVLALFEIFVNGSSNPIPESTLRDQNFTGIEAVGIVATLKEPEGLFAQCGWFGGDDLDWYWARITGWESFHLRADSRFRDGAPSVALRSEFAEYILLCPHPDYADSWELTRSFLGAPRCEIWPVGGLQPSWWPHKWDKHWPFDKSANAADAHQSEKVSLAIPDNDRLQAYPILTYGNYLCTTLPYHRPIIRRLKKGLKAISTLSQLKRHGPYELLLFEH